MSFAPEIEQAIEAAAARYSLPADFLRAVIGVESNGKPDKVSDAGAMGLMQLMPDTIKTLKVKDPFNVQENVNAGALYLRHLLDRFGAWERALAAYNWGPSYVEVTPSSGWPQSVRDYVSAVFARWVPGALPAFVTDFEPAPIDAPPPVSDAPKSLDSASWKLVAAAAMATISIAIIKSGVLDKS